jgi:hypothetical protein
MPITMQGSWTVAVKSKNAAFAQRFVVTGSSNGADGAHEYKGSTPPTPVTVEGSQWTVAVEHRSAKSKPWVKSDVRLGTPGQAGSTVAVDITSNDTGSDEDYNDLVLTCTTTVSDLDHIVYGRVRSYSGFCRFNPCWGPYLVLDTAEHLAAALGDAAVRPIVERLYPDRARAVERVDRIPEFAEPAGFRPLMLPLGGAGNERDDPISAKAVLGSSITVRNDYSTLARWKDLFVKPCITRSEPEQLLRFIEYDRTAAELAGDPYTGDGDRQILGLTVSDEIGNYLFRFTTSLADVVEEFDDIVPGGASTVVQLRPDVIAQVVTPGSGPDEYLYETGLHSDIPTLRRIDLCFPSSSIGSASCGTGRVFERIGDVFVLAGSANTFDAAGRISVHDSRADFQIDRAAWSGTLRIWGCFSEQADNPVKHYTIRYRKGPGSWQPVTEEEFRTNKNFLAQPPTHPAHRIGPDPVGLHVGGGPTQIVPAYKNIETDTDWVASTRHLKLAMQSALYCGVGAAGTVEFRIDGYDKNGQPVPGSTDSLVLFIDNDPATGDIESISLGSFSPGECALFELPTGQARAALTVTFRADQPNGHLQRYQLSVIRGSNNVQAVTGSKPIDLSYTPVMGASFRGTPDVPTSALGWLVADITPVNDWLPPTKNFCAFAFELWTTRRATDGRDRAHAQRQHIELIGISSE